jgi:serine protease Do
MSRALARTRLGLAVGGAFIGGLIFAAGFNITPFGYAQQTGETRTEQPPASVVEPLERTGNAFAAIAENVTPAVVSIQATRAPRTTRRGQQQQQQQQVPRGLEEFFEQFEGRRPQQRPSQGTGTGFIVSADGYILTNNHVVADADNVNVTLMDKRVFPARIVGRDPTTDVAVIKIEGNGFPFVRLGDDERARIGEWVLAIGNPLGLDFSVTAGIISAKGRSQQLAALYGTNYAIVDYIQTDAAINPGNSGGPLVNIRGEVIGINSAIASETGFYQGYGFAIPITLAKVVMDDLIEHGRPRRAVLGVGINEVNAETAQAAGMREIRGALVGSFTGDDSPARRAGLEPGDVIVTVAGRDVDRVATLQRVVREHKPGDVIPLEVMRYGTRRTFRVRLAEAPSEENVARAPAGDQRTPVEPASTSRLGISLENLSSEAARRANISEGHQGPVVRDVSFAGSAANQLFPSDIIVEAGTPSPRRRTRTIEELDRVLRQANPGDIVSLLVYRPEAQQTRIVNVRVME